MTRGAGSTSASRTRTWDAARAPYHTTAQRALGGSARRPRRRRSTCNGGPDGRVRRGRCVRHDVLSRTRGRRSCRQLTGPDGQPDVVSYHDATTIPNYWTYARNFVLQDRMFGPHDSWTLPAHLFLVSAWSAFCPDPKDPMSCTSDVDLEDPAALWTYGEAPDLRWTDITSAARRATTSRGATTSGDGTCWELPCDAGAGRLRRPGAATRCPGFVGRRDDASWRQHPDPHPTSGRGGRRDAAGRVVDRARRGGRASTRTAGPVDAGRPGVRDPAHQRRDGGPGLGHHRDLPDVGRLGRVLRSRAAAARRRATATGCASRAS